LSPLDQNLLRESSRSLWYQVSSKEKELFCWLSLAGQTYECP